MWRGRNDVVVGIGFDTRFRINYGTAEEDSTG